MKLVSVVFLFLLLGVFEEGYAYLDPGAGSYLVQILLATVLGALYSVKLFWGRIRLFFCRLFSRKKISDESSEKPSK